MISGLGLSAINASMTVCACAADQSLTWIFQSTTTVSTQDPGGGGGAPSVVNDHTGPLVAPAEFRATTCQKYVLALVKAGGVYDALLVPLTTLNVLMSMPPMCTVRTVQVSPSIFRTMVVKAYVVLAPGVSSDEGTMLTLQQHCKRVIAPYKMPRLIEFLPALPRTSTGKVQRFVLREMA